MQKNTILKDIIGFQEAEKVAMNVPQKRLMLSFSKPVWEKWGCIGFTFTEEEFEEADKSESKYLGERLGVDCYLLFDYLK